MSNLGLQAEAGQASTLTLKFDTKLLGDDDVQVRPFETNMSLWAGVDSLTAMVFLTWGMNSFWGPFLTRISQHIQYHPSKH